MNSAPDALRRAREFIEAGKPQLALPLLITHVKQHADSEQGWLLLSEVVPTLKQKVDCLQRTLRINPANAEARTRLANLLIPPAERWPQPSPLEDVPPPLAKPPQAEPPFDDRAVPRLEAPAESHFQPPESSVSPSQTAPASHQERVESPQADWIATLQSEPSDTTGLREAVNRQSKSPTPTQPARRAGLKDSQKLILGVLALVVVALLGAAIVLLIVPSNPATVDRPSAAVASLPTATPAPAQNLPPTWTATSFPPTWTPTPLPTVTPTRTPTPFPTLNATVSAQMDTIERQVADLRGLTLGTPVPRVLIGREAVEITLRTMLIDQGYAETLTNQARSLSALGLIKPTYDLIKYALNGLADNVGGFYISWLRQLFVIGTRFGGIERFVFAHEFDHALTDQHFDIDGLGVYPDCLSNAQRCAAIRALVEGDATLLMEQWFRQYAGPKDYQDILRYRPPAQTLPEDYPPPYVSRDLAFPYDAGLTFVEYLHQRGNWAEVNRAYANLPASTEQILHPEKYLAGEQPIEVSAPPLTDTLGAGWHLIDDDVLGEWTTYLILRAGADVAAQLKDSDALTASRGWGGDRYQVYYNETLSQTVLAVEWAWDTSRDAAEFKQAMLTYLNERFRGAKLDRSGGDCWEANHETSCLFALDKQTLWLLAPDVATLDVVQSAYPDFQSTP
jgi:hypothetical protein